MNDSSLTGPVALPAAAGHPDIVEELTGRGVRLQLGASVHDPTDPVGRLLFNVLAMVAEFEADLIEPGPGRAWRWPGLPASSAAASPSSPRPMRP